MYNKIRGLGTWILNFKWIKMLISLKFENLLFPSLKRFTLGRVQKGVAASRADTAASN